MLSICCAMLLLVLAVAVPSADAAASSEPSGQSVTAKASAADGTEVTAVYNKDALPADVSMSVQPVRGNGADRIRTGISGILQKTHEEISGIYPYQISFEQKDHKEAEPKDAVSLTIHFRDAVQKKSEGSRCM